jgi:phosphoserine phosphatase
MGEAIGPPNRERVVHGGGIRRGDGGWSRRYQGRVSRTPTQIDVPALLRRLVEERAKQATPDCCLLATDADGTLWTGDVGEALFEVAIERRLLRDEALPALFREASRLSPVPEGDANDVARSLNDAFKQGRYRRDDAFAMMAWSFAGYRRAELAQLATEVLDELGLGVRVRPALARVLAWAQDTGLEIVIVSASPQVIVEAAVADLGIAASQVFAMCPIEEEGVLMPALIGPRVYGDGKVGVVRSARPNATILGAFGDSAYDAALLRAARVPVGVCPTGELLELASTIEGFVVLETA